MDIFHICNLTCLQYLRLNFKTASNVYVPFCFVFSLLVEGLVSVERILPLHTGTEAEGTEGIVALSVLQVEGVHELLASLHVLS